MCIGLTLLIDLRTHHRRLGCVATRRFADVFAIDGCVYNVCYTPGPNSQFYSKTSKDVFIAQTHAFGLCQDIPYLREHTPRYFGIERLDGIVDEQGIDISSKYELDCCYVIERVIGPEEKVTAAEGRCEWIGRLRKCFTQHGIDTSDASIFNPNSEAAMKVIDFDMRGWA